MARYIDADKEIKGLKEAMGRIKINETAIRLVNDYIEWLENAPTVDVEEVRHGCWVEVNHAGNSKKGRHIKYSTKKCSVCGYCNGRRKTPRCPNCGAKMDGGKAE